MSFLHRIGVLKGYTGNMSVLNGYKVHIIDTDDDDKILLVHPTDTRNGRGNFGTLRTTLSNIDLSNITNEKEGDKEKKEEAKGAKKKKIFP